MSTQTLTLILAAVYLLAYLFTNSKNEPQRHYYGLQVSIFVAASMILNEVSK